MQKKFYNKQRTQLELKFLILDNGKENGKNYFRIISIELDIGKQYQQQNLIIMKRKNKQIRGQSQVQVLFQEIFNQYINSKLNDQFNPFNQASYDSMILIVLLGEYL
ncbi:unnamed protein product [Paramecium sonneborni]|uniref:Uncharacterized protein n=1 Tax=Paramecium sonneborni TaxID=65129 RepID=A0A8S1PTT6_9CILI|nr:unnamed protein product [Paramecium sonneborni]